MGFLRKDYVVTIHNRVCGCEFPKALNVQPPLLQLERFQLRWLGHVTRMPQRLARGVPLAASTGKRPRSRPRTRWCD